MSIQKKVSTLAVLSAVIAFTVAAPAFAEEGGLGGFFRKLFKYPVKTTENVANATGHVVENTGGVVAAAASNTGAVVTGDISKTPNIVTEPVEKTANMTGQALSETAGAPVKAAEDVAAEEDSSIVK